MVNADLPPAPERSVDIVIELVSVLAGELGRPALVVCADSDLDREVGLDSLARIELAARLERHFGVQLDEEAAFGATTPAALAALIAGAGARGPAGEGLDRGVAAAGAAGTGPDGNGIDTARPARIAPRSTRGVPASNARTLIEVLRFHAESDPQRTHVHFYADQGDGEAMSHGALLEAARCVAGGLGERGVVPGDTVAIMLPTGRDYLSAFFGIMLAGAVAVPIYPPARRSQLEDHLRRQGAVLRNAQARALVTLDDAIAVARLLTAQVDTLAHVETVRSLGSEPAREVFDASPDDVAFLQYTSGSTGDPKGVVLTHANLLANIRADGAGLAVRSDDVFVSWLPLYHDMGLIGAWLGSLYHGIPLVLMSPLSFLSRPHRWLQAIDRFGGTLSAAPNFAYELCVRRIRDADIEGLDLSRWRLSLNGAEAISAVTLRAFQARFEPWGLSSTTVLPVYGLAECAVGLAFSPLGRPPRIDRVSRDALLSRGFATPAADDDPAPLEVVACGVALPEHELRVVDDADRELPERVQGRLQFRGPSATPGYHRAPEATAELIRNGWHETGDLAYIAGGELHITGRVKDLIIRAGRNIHPMELEGRVSEEDGVRGGRVAAFGSADPVNGTERLVLVVETRRRDEDERQALRARITELSVDLVGVAPDEVVLAPPGTILRTSSGKVRRAACRDLFESGRIGTNPRPAWIALLGLAASGVGPQLWRAGRTVAEHLYSAWAWSNFAVFSLVAFAAALLPVSLRSRWSVLHRIARVLASLCAIRITRTGEFPCRDGVARIAVCNHQSYLDGFVLMASLDRPVSFLAKAELTGIAPVRLMLERIGTRFVRRFDPAAAVADLRTALEETDGEAPLFVFPEGTFKRMPGVLPFRLGGFVAAVEAGAEVVPVSIAGTRSLLRSGSWRPRPGAVQVTIGVPIRPEGNARDWHSAVALRDAVRRTIIESADEPDLVYASNRVQD